MAEGCGAGTRFGVAAREPVACAQCSPCPACNQLAGLDALLTGCNDEADPLDSDEGYSVLDAMEELPASIRGDVPLILTGDLARASEVAGLDRPTDAHSDEVNAWIGGLTAATGPDETARAFVPLPDALIPYQSSPADMDAQVGWSVTSCRFVRCPYPATRELPGRVGRLRRWHIER